MGGGLMQLVAYGAQDIYLTGNPQITFFKVVYRRHTNFSMESIQQTLNGSVSNNSRVTSTISRNGDLVGRMYLQSTSIDGDLVVNSGITDINKIEVEIGGQTIDKQTGQFLEVMAELGPENSTGRQIGTNYQYMSGHGAGVPSNNSAAPADNAAGASIVPFRTVDQNATVQWLPLRFWFNRNAGLALPLIALQYHEVKVVITFNTVTHSGHKLWADYIYLDTDERRRFAQVSHEYLIEQVQENSITAGAKSVELNFNHPVKELIWCGDLDSGVLRAFGAAGDTIKLVLNGHDRFAARESRYFSRVQVYQHHSGDGGHVDMSIGVYSFALKPEEHQPSGTCNFSRIDNARLLNNGTNGFGANTAPCTCYAVNYNVLRIMSGMGGLAYSN